MKLPSSPSSSIADAVQLYLDGRFPVALTGAGISVASGIPDFRSPGGVWSRFDPAKYGTLETFLIDPLRAWKFYGALADLITDAKPGKAHRALARLERNGNLKGIVTQNIDGLHRAAGSKIILEVHGTHELLHCLQCSHTEPTADQFVDPSDPPKCPECDSLLKPDVVLFGEPIRRWEAVESLVAKCDLLLVIGTSSSVYPVAELPQRVKAQGGILVEFNLTETTISPLADVILSGEIESTVPSFVRSVLGGTPSTGLKPPQSLL